MQLLLKQVFPDTWAKIHQDSEYIVFDITSFYSYAKKLEWLEWGYNRDGESLPQVNLGFVYLNEKLRAQERERLSSQVLDIEQKLKEPSFSSKQDIETFLSETLRGSKTIFQITEKDGKTTSKRNEKGITDRLERMGTMILLSNRTMDGEEILHLYRRKDAVKHELERKRLRIHTQETFEGRLFLDFVALILYAWISKVMRREDISKDLVGSRVDVQIEKDQTHSSWRKKTVVTEVSKRQRELFKAFEIKSPRQT